MYKLCSTRSLWVFLSEYCIANKTQTGLIIMQLNLVSYSFQYSNPSPTFLQESSFAKVEGGIWSKSYLQKLSQIIYDAGKWGLVETVCEVVTHISSTDILRLHYSPSQTIATSQACKYCLLCIIVAVAAVLSSSYISQSTHPLNLGNFLLTSSDEDAFQTKLGRPLYGQNAEKIAPNDLPHLPGPFVGRDEDVNNVTNILFSAHSVVQMHGEYSWPSCSR